MTSLCGATAATSVQRSAWMRYQSQDRWDRDVTGFTGREFFQSFRMLRNTFHHICSAPEWRHSRIKCDLAVQILLACKKIRCNSDSYDLCCSHCQKQSRQRSQLSKKTPKDIQIAFDIDSVASDALELIWILNTNKSLWVCTDRQSLGPNVVRKQLDKYRGETLTDGQATYQLWYCCSRIWRHIYFVMSQKYPVILSPETWPAGYSVGSYGTPRCTHRGSD